MTPKKSMHRALPSAFRTAIWEAFDFFSKLSGRESAEGSALPWALILTFNKTVKNRFIRLLFQQPQKTQVHTFLAAAGGLRRIRRIEWRSPFYREIVRTAGNCPSITE